MYIYIYIYTYTHCVYIYIYALFTSLSLSLYIYIYIYMPMSLESLPKRRSCRGSGAKLPPGLAADNVIYYNIIWESSMLYYDKIVTICYNIILICNNTSSIVKCKEARPSSFHSLLGLPQSLFL